MGDIQGGEWCLQRHSAVKTGPCGNRGLIRTLEQRVGVDEGWAGGSMEGPLVWISVLS